MGFVGFLRFSLLCFDFLAWPVLALGYPLWASVQAIETSSKYHMRKLVTYWTIFSFLSLFEIFFVKLIQWVPFWPYIKLVAICWLVIPKFNGACHAYECLIHPCLSVNLQNVINWLCIPKEKPSSGETFLASVETYLEENGPKALEKLITSKAKSQEQILADDAALEVVKRVEPIKKIEPTEKIDAAEEQLVVHPEQCLVESEKKKIAAVEAQKATIPAESIDKRPLEIHALKKVQREWTCAMCQVTTTSEATLNSHLLGSKHRSKWEQLNTCTQTAKNTQCFAEKQKSKSEELKTSIQTEKNLKSSAVKTNISNQAKKNHQNCPPGEGSKQNRIEKEKSTHVNAAIGQQRQGKPKNKNAGVVNQQSKFWCGICNIRCPGEIDMAAHLNGRKHLLQVQSKTSSGGGQA